jgi:hypothetical protein
MDINILQQALISAKTDQDFDGAQKLAATYLNFFRQSEKASREIELVYRSYLEDLVQRSGPEEAIAHFEKLNSSMERRRKENPDFVLIAAAGLARAIIELRAGQGELSRTFQDILKGEKNEEEPEEQLYKALVTASEKSHFDFAHGSAFDFFRDCKKPDDENTIEMIEKVRDVYVSVLENMQSNKEKRVHIEDFMSGILSRSQQNGFYGTAVHLAFIVASSKVLDRDPDFSQLLHHKAIEISMATTRGEHARYDAQPPEAPEPH